MFSPRPVHRNLILLTHRITNVNRITPLPQIQPLSQIHKYSLGTMAQQQSFKLSTITTLADLEPGQKIEASVDGIENGKVLLTNIGGQVSAVGSRCTHYGAPLVKGVLSADGRITCPWHGGMCFSKFEN